MWLWGVIIGLTLHKNDTDSQVKPQTGSFEVNNELVKNFIMKHYEASRELQQSLKRILRSSH
jgi:hypothetical protein